MPHMDLKGCPRCHGDVIHDQYTSEDYESYCLQCSYRLPEARKEIRKDQDTLAYFREIGLVKGDNVSANG